VSTIGWDTGTKARSATMAWILGARTMSEDDASRRLRLFLSEPFEAGRHTRRVDKIRGIEKTIQAGPAPAAQREAPMSFLKETDPEIYDVLRRETERQASTLELIASENFVSEAVLEATGSVLTNKYAEGYPGKRYYGGCEFVDQAESLAIERAKRLFGAEHVNVQPHTGSSANMAAYYALLELGDTVLMALLGFAVAALATLYPARQASRLYPIEAIRDE